MDQKKNSPGYSEKENHCSNLNTPQNIVVFQQEQSGERKIAGLRKYGGDRFSLKIISIDEDLPDIIDDPYDFIPRNLDADLVLDFLKHPDLSYDLAVACRDLSIPVIASGKKSLIKEVITPPT